VEEVLAGIRIDRPLLHRFIVVILLTSFLESNIVPPMGDRPLEATPLPGVLDRGTLSQTDPRSPGPTGVGDAVPLDGSPPASLGQQVLDFARQRIGQQVGDGECFALADQALRHAGAGSAADFGPVGADTDYIWSSQTASAANAQAGDIIQFRNFTVETRTDNADGSWQTTSESRPHHTAVVVSNDGAGNLTILEQNVQIGGTSGQARRTVRQNQIPVSSGTRSRGTSTITIQVSGTMVVYRPVPRPAP
jgi:hypothetical protein